MYVFVPLIQFNRMQCENITIKYASIFFETTEAAQNNIYFFWYRQSSTEKLKRVIYAFRGHFGQGEIIFI